MCVVDVVVDDVDMEFFVCIVSFVEFVDLCYNVRFVG